MTHALRNSQQTGALSIPLVLLFLASLVGLGACSTTPPDGMTAVTPFDIKRYAGKWYEVARLDHSFERGLSDVSATYSQKADGSLEVINWGFDSSARRPAGPCSPVTRTAPR